VHRWETPPGRSFAGAASPSATPQSVGSILSSTERYGPQETHPTTPPQAVSLYGRRAGDPAPPCRPGRAVFPPPVLRLDSLPRCQAKPSGTHAPTWNRGTTRTRALDAGEDAGTRLPRVAAPLAAPPLAPWERPVDRPRHKAVKRAGGPAPALVVGVAPSSRLPTLAAGPAEAGGGGALPCAGGTRLGAAGGRDAA
jgi:hypothetical protein